MHPLVRQLLDIVGRLQNRIQELEDEILRLKGLKTQPSIAPSPLETPARPLATRVRSGPDQPSGSRPPIDHGSSGIPGGYVLTTLGG